MTTSSLNYFELFSLPQSFQVDDALLQRRYGELQAAHHPDRFAGADDGERLRALQQASLINDAFVTLHSPLKRAAYLLVLAGENPDRHDQSQLQPEFLLEQMQLREALESCIESGDLAALDAMKVRATREIAGDLEAFAARYQARDLQAAKVIYHRLQFQFKLREEINAIEEKLLDY